MSEEQERHSHALEPELVADPDEIARIEARNGDRFDAVTEMMSTSPTLIASSSSVLPNFSICIESLSTA